MKFRYLFLFIIILSHKVSGEHKTVNSNFIRFKHTYESLRLPVPELVFYREIYTTDDMVFWGVKYALQEDLFNSIVKLVEKESSFQVIDTMAHCYYQISVQINGQTQIFATDSYSKTKSLFELLLQELRDIPLQDSVKKNVDSFLYLLGPGKRTNNFCCFR